MFTGIVEEIGTVREVTRGDASAKIGIRAEKVLKDVRLGDSIAVNGVCLTVTEFSERSFSADVMHETMNRSSLADIKAGTHINLERAMKIGDRFGGHIVSGHIDGTGIIKSTSRDDNAVWYEIETEPKIMKYIIEKGSVAIDGISLTVAKVHEKSFSVSVIPHTAEVTILGEKSKGSTVNIENDCIGKYVERLMYGNKEKEERKSGITMEFLMKNGF